MALKKIKIPQKANFTLMNKNNQKEYSNYEKLKGNL